MPPHLSPLPPKKHTCSIHMNIECSENKEKESVSAGKYNINVHLSMH